MGGHSWGATLALIYAMAYPQCTRATITIASGGLQNDRSWSEAYRAGRDAGRDQTPPMAYPPNLEVNRVLNEAVRAYIHRPRLWRDVADLTVPVLIIDGDDDIRPSWPNEQIAALLPNSRYHRIGGAGHCPWFTHAGALSELLNGFLDALPEEPIRS